MIMNKTIRQPLVALALLLLLCATGCHSVAPQRFEGLPEFSAVGVFGQEAPADDDEQEAMDEEEVDADVEADDGDSVGWHILMYIPNRIFDVFDIVRARVRLGPGIAISVRATDAVDLNLGTYAAIWVGLHGHRGEPSIPWPVGLETFTGAELSLAKGAIEGDAGPNYGPVEFGAGVQILLVGVDVGVEPLEILDLVAGFFFIDLVGDDY